MVSVGYLIETVQDVISPTSNGFCSGFSDCSGLVPWAPGSLQGGQTFHISVWNPMKLLPFTGKTALLESIREGIIAINEQGEV